MEMRDRMSNKEIKILRELRILLIEGASSSSTKQTVFSVFGEEFVAFGDRGLPVIDVIDHTLWSRRAKRKIRAALESGDIHMVVAKSEGAFRLLQVLHGLPMCHWPSHIVTIDVHDWLRRSTPKLPDRLLERIDWRNVYQVGEWPRGRPLYTKQFGVPRNHRVDGETHWSILGCETTRSVIRSQLNRILYA